MKFDRKISISNLHISGIVIALLGFSSYYYDFPFAPPTEYFSTLVIGFSFGLFVGGFFSRKKSS